MPLRPDAGTDDVAWRGVATAACASLRVKGGLAPHFRCSSD